MGIRFRKSFKIAPGIRLNLNKKSAGITFGTRGAHYTLNTKGKKTASVGIPGTGLSYTSTSGGSSSKSSNLTGNNTQKPAPNNQNDSDGQKWYQKISWIIALLFLFFPVGLFLMWKYANWNKYVKIGISVFWGIVSLILLSSTGLEKITLSADTTRSYDRNEEILIEYTTEPSDYTLYASDFEKTGGHIRISDDKVYFSSLFTGTYEIYAEKSGIRSNTITITIEDKNESAETEAKEDINDSELQNSRENQNDLLESQTVTDAPSDTSTNVEQNNTQNTPVAVPDTSINNEESTDTTPVEPETYSYILNTSTNKFHVPSCSSVSTIKPENYGTFEGTRDGVINQGYEPCGRCHP